MNKLESLGLFLSLQQISQRCYKLFEQVDKSEEIGGYIRNEIATIRTEIDDLVKIISEVTK